MTDHQKLLDTLRAAADGGRWPDPGARGALVELQDPALMRKAGRLLTRLRPDDESALPRIRVAISATCTVGSLEYLLRAALIGAGFLPEIEQGAYRGFEMSLATGQFAGNGDPDLIAALLDESFFLPGDWSPADLDGFEKHVEARLEDLRGLIAAGLERTSAVVVLHTVPLPQEVRDTFVSLRARARVAQLWHRVNAAILDLAEEHRQVAAVDLVGSLADAPVAARDVRLHRYGDMPYTDGALLILAQQVRRIAQAKLGLSRKVLALDLDNTLWGGVLGEVGTGGVQLGGLYPGNCYLELQRTVRRLREQGIVLVLASKNDAPVVEEALTAHPEVVLRPDMFSVTAVNWSAKAGNLRYAAETLGLSADSFVFIDDSDFERAQVHSELPEVAIVSAAGDPAHLVSSLLRPGWFDTTTLTETDRNRPGLYRRRAMRSDFSAGFGSSEEFLRALDITVEIAPVTGFSVGRVAQLSARTNQFNLTGIRFDEAATAAMTADPGHLVASVAMSDRFGAEGIVGAVWVERGQRTWRVLNMVLSCRVLARGVELAVVGWLAAKAHEAGADLLEGRFIRSAKNGAAADFWTKAGAVASGGDGETFELDLHRGLAEVPQWITLREGSDVK